MDYWSLVTLVKNYYSVADNMPFICAPVNYSYNLSYEQFGLYPINEIKSYNL